MGGGGEDRGHIAVTDSGLGGEGELTRGMDGVI